MTDDQIRKELNSFLLHLKDPDVIGDFSRLREIVTNEIAELKKQAKIKDSLAKGVMTLAEVYEQLEDAKVENQRLRDRMIEAKQVVEKAHGKPNKDACCETCYILEQLDKWIEALDPQGEEPCGE